MKTIFCDACGQRFEGAAAGSNCPVCGAGMLVVEESKPTESELAEKMAEEQRRKTIHEAERIEDNAVILSFVGKVALLVFAFALLAMFLCEGSAYWLSLWIASAALTIFFGLQILAQLLYIRAKLTAR